MRRLAALGFGLAFVTLWLAASPPSAHAAHYAYLGQGANNGEFGYNADYTWTMKTWALDGGTTKWCGVDRGDGYVIPQKQAILAAIGDWESRFDFFPPPKAEFTNACGQHSMDIVDYVGWGDTSCGTLVACILPWWWYDSDLATNRGGYYLSYVRLLINTRDYAFNSFGMQATVAHELGHVYGLNEQYLHGPPITCNGIGPGSGVYSIMDVAFSTSHCDGINSPTASDAFGAENHYKMMDGSYQPHSLASAMASSTSMSVLWNDSSPTESYYAVQCYYFNGATGSWVLYSVFPHYLNVAPGDPWENRRLSDVCPKAVSYSMWYNSCIHVTSPIIGNAYPKCLSSQYWQYF